LTDPGQLLKQDTFGSIRRDGRRVLRDTRAAQRGCAWLARHLARREYRALSELALGNGVAGVPRVLEFDGQVLVREWLDGAPMQLARPGDAAYFRAAARLVRALHARRVLHNDLAKETNWLVTPAGTAALVDFQLAKITGRRRSALERSLGHDDIRHLLKHKRTYLPERLTAREQRILATPSLVSRLWMASGKRVYLFVTRRIFRWRDREGAGDRAPGR
jgi:RIO-like serine/threonine protein kinase